MLQSGGLNLLFPAFFQRRCKDYQPSSTLYGIHASLLHPSFLDQYTSTSAELKRPGKSITCFQFLQNKAVNISGRLGTT